MALWVRLLLPLSLMSLVQWTKRSWQTDLPFPDWPTSRLSSLRLWLNNSSPTRSSTSLPSRLPLLSGNLITLTLRQLTSMQQSLTSTDSKRLEPPISLPALISPSALLQLSEESICYPTECLTQASPQLQASKNTSQTRTLLSQIRFTWTQFPSSWLALNPPLRDHSLSNSWIPSPMQPAAHSRGFHLLHETNTYYFYYLFVFYFKYNSQTPLNNFSKFLFFICCTDNSSCS